MTADDHLSPGQFYDGYRKVNQSRLYHGTAAELRPGDLIEPGHPAINAPTKPGDVHFSASIRGAHTYASHAARVTRKRGQEDAEPHVYRVRPSGPFRDDPLEPGDPEYVSRHPLHVVAEVTSQKHFGPWWP